MLLLHCIFHPTRCTWKTKLLPGPPPNTHHGRLLQLGQALHPGRHEGVVLGEGGALQQGEGPGYAVLSTCAQQQQQQQQQQEQQQGPVTASASLH